MSLTIYKASAGSGKTFALSATFIAHLVSDPDTKHAHRHQLAVTFTNKATAEMKTRILQYLFSLAHSKDDEDGFFKAVRKLVPKEISNDVIRTRAATALQSIIHDYDHFHVTTIDSFFQSLLSNMAHELGLSSNFKVEIGDKEVLSKAVDRLLTNLEEESPEVEHITDYIRERLGEDRSWDVSGDLKKLAGEILRENYMLNRDLLHAADGDEGIDLSYQVVANYKKTLAAYKAQQISELVNAAKEADELIRNGVGYEAIPHGKSWVGNCLQKLMGGTVSDAPSASFCKFASGDLDLISKKALRENPSLAGEAPAVQAALTKVVEEYPRACFVTNSCNLSRKNVNPLLLLDAIDKEVRKLNEENDRVMLAYTPMLFYNLAGENDASFIFERAGTQYRHVMIDEFQDTSKLQWANLHHLLVENMAQGNSCMLVGDVKQGIYRFRGGDWNTLASFRKGRNKSLNADVDIEMLDTNYRSGKRIVEFNNRFFVAAAHVTRDLLREKWGMDLDEADNPNRNIENIYPTPDPDDDSHEVTQLPHNEGGYVRVELYNEKTADDKDSNGKNVADEETAEAETSGFSVKESLAEQILRLKASGVPFNKMAILVRKQKSAEELLQYFEKEHSHDSENPIPLISEEAFLLGSSETVQTIINALRCVATPNHNIAWNYVRMKCPKKNLKEMEECFSAWSAERYTGLPFYEMSCAIIRLFGLDEMPGQSPYIYSFLDNVITYTEDHNADIVEFLKYWDETLHSTSIPSASVNGIRLLTIHKSKGLDFHTVFIPYCDWKYVERSGNLLWLRPSAMPYNDIPLLPIAMDNGARDSIYRKDALQEDFDTYVENLNLAYVAFTRTRQNLLVWTDCSSETTLAPMVSGALKAAQLECKDSGYGTRVYESGSPSKLECKTEDNDAESKNKKAKDCKAETTKNDNPLDFEPDPIRLDFTHYAPRLSFRQSTNARVFLNVDGAGAEADAVIDVAAENEAEQREVYRKTGILLHLLMSTIEVSAEVDAKVDAFAQAGMLPATLSVENVKRLIRSRISSPDARPWFDGTWKLFRECSLLYKEDGEIVCKRPDRVMVRGDRSQGTDEMIVVDFKFGRHEKEHEDQVALYKDLLRRQGASKVKGYLWYLYNGEILEV